MTVLPSQYEMLLPVLRGSCHFSGFEERLPLT